MGANLAPLLGAESWRVGVPQAELAAVVDPPPTVPWWLGRDG